MENNIQNAKKYKVIIRGEEIKIIFVDNLDDVDFSDHPMETVTILGSSKSIDKIQKSQDILAKKAIANLSKLSKLLAT